MYMADNLVFFPYTAADEPLYIIHNIDIIVSVAGSNLLQSFREVSSSTTLPSTCSVVVLSAQIVLDRR